MRWATEQLSTSVTAAKRSWVWWRVLPDRCDSHYHNPDGAAVAGGMRFGLLGTGRGLSLLRWERRRRRRWGASVVQRFGGALIRRTGETRRAPAIHRAQGAWVWHNTSMLSMQAEKPLTNMAAMNADCLSSSWVTDWRCHAAWQ